jgi:iron(III) transport system substrate-binding protein
MGRIPAEQGGTIAADPLAKDPLNTPPASLLELTNSRWRGKVSLAFPLFGTTATHLHALRQHWGDSNWTTWCRALAANQPLLEEGNSQVVRRVARGEAAVGLTDSDDIEAGRREGLAVAALLISQDMLAIPNTVGVIRGAPHPEAAQKLADHLMSPEVRAKLVAVAALEDGAADGSTLRPDWPALLRELDRSTARLQEIFRR